MAEVYIPFLPEFKEALLNDDKIATSRNKCYGQPGDTFTIFGARFKILKVIKMPLDFVAGFFYKCEGFDTPQGFINIWQKIHPRTGYTPHHEVYLHLFYRLRERPDDIEANLPLSTPDDGSVLALLAHEKEGKQ